MDGRCRRGVEDRKPLCSYICTPFTFFLAIFRTVRVTRVQNRALYHSDGFGLFVEIESMSRLFFSWCCIVMVSRTYCHEEYKSVPVFFSYLPISGPRSTPKIMLCKTNYKFSFDLSPSARHLESNLSPPGFKSAQTPPTPKFPYSYLNQVDDTPREVSLCGYVIHGGRGRLTIS